MKKVYDGLKAVKIPFVAQDVLTASPSNCWAIVAWKMENGVCVSDDDWKDYEWYDDHSL